MKKTLDGVILRERPSGDSDKILTVLTAEEGRISLIVKGGRSPRSKLRAVCQLYNYVNLEYYEKNDLRWASDGSTNVNFFKISEDLEGASLAAYLSEIAIEISDEGAPAPELLRMLLNSLYCIQDGKKPLGQVKAVFEWLAASASGFRPNLCGCAECGGTESEDFWLDVMNGRLYCADCLGKRQVGSTPLPEDEYRAKNILLPLSPWALSSVRYVLSAPISRSLAFSTNDDEGMENFSRGAEVYLLNHLERSFPTLDFYKNVNDFE